MWTRDACAPIFQVKVHPLEVGFFLWHCQEAQMTQNLSGYIFCQNLGLPWLRLLAELPANIGGGSYSVLLEYWRNSVWSEVGILSPLPPSALLFLLGYLTFCSGRRQLQRLPFPVWAVWGSRRLPLLACSSRFPMCLSLNTLAGVCWGNS